jgi:hypothetical protein
VAVIVALTAIAVTLTNCSRADIADTKPRHMPTTSTTRPPVVQTTTIATLVSAGQIPSSTQVLVLNGPTPISGAPGGPPTGTEPGTVWGSVETLPLIASNGTWAQVLLPGLPNGSSGWVPLTAGTVQSDPWFLQVNMATRQITAYDNGTAVMTAPAAIGAPRTPTPMPPGGLSFLAGSLSTVGKYRVESPALRPLALQVTGAVAAVDDAAVGGRQVAIHGWEGEQTNSAVWGPTSGLPVSHACVRVPKNFAAGPLSAAPNGTLVGFVGA